MGFRAGVAEGEENGIGVGVEVDDGLVVTNVVAVGRTDGVEGRGAEGVKQPGPYFSTSVTTSKITNKRHFDFILVL